MNNKPIVLVQKRKDSHYNDFVGKFYHFPAKYRNVFSGLPVTFVYFDPITGGTGTYFGSGKVIRIFEDQQQEGHFFAELEEYRPFAVEVPFRDTASRPMEAGPSYKPQNSVRRIDVDEHSRILNLGGTKTPFTADTHLIKVLGEQLITSEVVGILELIKNSFDAKATHCRVRIEQMPNFGELSEAECEFPGFQGPVIVVEDDGEGMDLKSIQDGWMRPASTIKTNTKEQLKKEREAALKSGTIGSYDALYRELKKRHGRIPLGEKGVGRFATHRLGQKLLLRTKTKDSEMELCLGIDWSDFDRSVSEGPADLSSIHIVVTPQLPTRKYPNGSGTCLVVHGGRAGFEITSNTIKEINRSILKLQSPTKAPESFSVSFECPQAIDLDEMPLVERFSPAFSVDALFDSAGEAEIEWRFRPPESTPLASQFESENLDLRKGELKHWINEGTGELRTPKCGPFFIHLDVWYRSKPWIDGPFVRDFQLHLENFGGISIYRDGLNILPSEWGTRVDWLDLSKRHIKKTVNISYYNFIGQLEIDQIANFELTDKTDREGLLKNQAFLDLSHLTRSLILHIENHFKGKRDHLKKLTQGLRLDPKEIEDDATNAATLISRIADRYDIAKDAAGLFEGMDSVNVRHDHLVNLAASLKNLQSSLEAMEEVQSQLTEQAGYGLALGVAVHEVTKITANFYAGLAKALKSEIPDRELLEPLQDSARSLKQELQRLGPFRAVRNEKSRVFSVSKSIAFVKEVFRSQLEKYKIEFSSSGTTFDIYARYGVMNQIITNLVDNAIYWLRASNQSARKKIQVMMDHQSRSVVVSDNGEGISVGIRPYLFDPGYSLKQPPSGLGLYICKYYMKSMGGDIYECPVDKQISDMSGAQFCLDFSRISEGDS